MCCVPVLYLSLTTAERYPSGCLYLSLRNPNVSSIDFFPQELWANFILCCIICCIYSARFITYLLRWANFRQSCCVKFKFKSLWAQPRKVEFFAKICYNLSETKVFINWRNCGVFSGILTTIKHLILWATYLII